MLLLIVGLFGSVLSQDASVVQPAPPCLHPGNIEHGISDWNGTGNVARFACYQGYYLVGPPELKCRYGSWYTDAQVDRPTCKPVVCGHIDIPHGSLTSGIAVKYRTGEHVAIVCHEGFKLKHESNNKIVCREDGTWSSLLGTEFPYCEERGCTFSDTSMPDTGHVEVNGIRITIGPSFQYQEGDSTFGIYMPGSVMKHTCQSGWVVVPVSSANRACRMGRWDGSRGKCVPKSPRIKPRGSCPPPPLINNGYFLSELAERFHGEKPYVLPVSGAYQHTYEVGAVARYHCNDGYRLHMLFGQDIYRCTAAGYWVPKQPPVCVSKTNNLEPLAEMMCQVPEDVTFATYRAVEGVVTPNGALHGTILEYNCNIGYRDTILPCLPSRRTCHAGEWVGSLPSCAPFEFCPSVPRIQNGYLATPREEVYRLHSIIKYGCDRGFWLVGEDTMQCQATGCWEPNALPKCIDENLLSTWNEDAGSVSLIVLLLSVCGALLLVSVSTAVCGVLACRRKRVPPPAGPAHWSTHVTVTPNCRGGRDNGGDMVGLGGGGGVRDSLGMNGNGLAAGIDYSGSGVNGQTSAALVTAGAPGQQDRVALIAFADQEPVILPSYEEALRETSGNSSRTRGDRSNGYGNNGRQHPPHRSRSRHAQEHIVQVNGGYTGGRRTGRSSQQPRHDPDTVSHGSLGCSWPVRQHSATNSQTASLRSGSIQSVETAGNSETTTGTTEASQTPSCRALAGSLASFETAGGNTEGVPLLEEHEFESTTNSISEHGDTASAYSDTSNKSINNK